MTAPLVTQASLKAMLDYDMETGVFHWRQRDDVRANWNTRWAGKRAGYQTSIAGKLYWFVRVHDWPFPAHRLAWLYVTGEWPEILVDHEDNDGLNNRWSNLRHADKTQNGGNSTIRKNNRSGFKGVSVCRKSGRFKATITVAGRQKWLGYHASAEAAHAAYLAAATEVFGDFARAS